MIPTSAHTNSRSQGAEGVYGQIQMAIGSNHTHVSRRRSTASGTNSSSR